MFKKYLKNTNLHLLLPAIALFITSYGIIFYKTKKLYLLQFSQFVLLFMYIVILTSFLYLLIFITKKYKSKIYYLFIYTLPTEILLLSTIYKADFTQTSTLPWLFAFTSHVWILLFLFYKIHTFTLKNKQQLVSLSNKPNPTSRVEKFSPTLILIAILVIHFIFGINNLGKASYVDERLWTYSKEKRIEKYWSNILEFDWKNARPSDKPGISLAFISGPSLLFVTPSYFTKNILDKEAFSHMLFVMRLPILIFSTLSLVFFYYILKTLFNTTISLFAIIFISLSPLLIGMSRIINPDAISWIILPLTIYSYFTYQKTKLSKWLYLTGFLLGWGLLTKYITNLLFPFFILSILTQNLFIKKLLLQDLRKNIKSSLLSLLMISTLALITFYIFYPGTWVKPDRLLIGTIWSEPFLPIWQYFISFIGLLSLDYLFLNSLIFVTTTLWLRKVRIFIISIPPLIFITSIILLLYNIYFAPQPIDFETIISSPKTVIDKGIATNSSALITSFYVLLFGISPIAFLGVLFTLIASLVKKRTTELSYYLPQWHLLLFILIFYASSIFSTTLPIIRYQIVLYPLILTISAYGWYFIIQKITSRRKSFCTYLLMLLFILISIFTLNALKPHYFSYNSPLLPKEHLINIKDMGDGSYEAAEFLNNLPNAKNLKIWSDKRGVCNFFIGTVCSGSIKKSAFLKNGPVYDYFVISKGRENLTLKLSRGYSLNKPDYPIHLKDLYESPDAIFEIHPGNRSENYIKIIPEDKVHVWR